MYCGQNENQGKSTPKWPIIPQIDPQSKHTHSQFSGRVASWVDPQLNLLGKKKEEKRYTTRGKGGKTACSQRNRSWTRTKKEKKERTGGSRNPSFTQKYFPVPCLSVHRLCCCPFCYGVRSVVVRERGREKQCCLFVQGVRNVWTQSE